jgi:uncharacterized protein YgiM (DUF1202 family)
MNRSKLLRMVLVLVTMLAFSILSACGVNKSEKIAQTATAVKEKSLTATARPTIEAGDLDLQVTCVVSTTYSDGLLNVHKIKDSGSEVVASVKEGEKVRVTKIDGEWFFLEGTVEKDGTISGWGYSFSGWVKSQYCIVQD